MAASVERTAVLCSLLAVLALAHRARLLAVVVATAGIGLLVIRDAVDVQRRRGAAYFTEGFDEPERQEQEEQEEMEAEPEKPPETPTPSPSVYDDDYRRGIVVGEHSGRPDSYRFATSRPAADAASFYAQRQPTTTPPSDEQCPGGDAQSADRAVRNRLLHRVAPSGPGRYRSTTGQMTKFAIY